MSSLVRIRLFGGPLDGGEVPCRLDDLQRSSVQVGEEHDAIVWPPNNVSIAYAPSPPYRKSHTYYKIMRYAPGALCAHSVAWVHSSCNADAMRLP